MMGEHTSTTTRGGTVNLTVTELAQERLSSLIGERARESGQSIRVFIAGGGCGCSGPRFGMGLDDATDEDTVITVGPLSFAVDPATAPVLDEASIDYIEDVMQQGFSITAPNAATGGGCGCGGGGH
jgi:iron-sulfur cluster insertion protein